MKSLLILKAGASDCRHSLSPHSNAFHNCITGGSFTEVPVSGMPSVISHLKPENNIYKNPFGTEIALSDGEGGTARMATVGLRRAITVSGAVRGQGSY